MTKNNFQPAKILSENKTETWESLFPGEQVKVNEFSVNGKFLHIVVGTDANPANPEYIEETRNNIEKLIKDNGLNIVVFVTPHDVAIKLVI